MYNDCINQQQRDTDMKFQITTVNTYDASFTSNIIEAVDIIDCMMKYYETDDEDLKLELQESLKIKTNQGLSVNESGGWKSHDEEQILLIVEV